MVNVEIKEWKPCVLANIEHLGEYGSIPFEYFPQLYAFAKAQKVMLGFLPMALYFDNPSQTPPEKCRSEIAISITGSAKSNGEVKIRNLPAVTVAVIKHKAPAKEFEETYRKLANWISINGYAQAVPSIEIYIRKPKVVGKETIIYTHIQMPIKSK